MNECLRFAESQPRHNRPSRLAVWAGDLPFSRWHRPYTYWSNPSRGSAFVLSTAASPPVAHPQYPTGSSAPYLMAGGEAGGASGHWDESSSAWRLRWRFESRQWRNRIAHDDTRDEHAVSQDAGGSSRRQRSRSRRTRSDGELAHEAAQACREGGHPPGWPFVDGMSWTEALDLAGYPYERRRVLDGAWTLIIVEGNKGRDKGHGKGNDTDRIDASGQLTSSSVSPGASVSDALPSPSQRQCSTEWTDGVTTPPEAFPDTMPEFAAS